MDTQEDGERHRARIVEALDEHDRKIRNANDVRKFRVSINDDEMTVYALTGARLRQLPLTPERVLAAL